MVRSQSQQSLNLSRMIKKFFLSSFVILTFIAYAIDQRLTKPDTAINPPPVPPTVVTPQAILPAGASASLAQANLPPATMLPEPSPTLVGMYRDGTYNGPQVDAYYGLVQVQVNIQNGKIADVQFLQYPNDRRTSRQINAIAMPYLQQEALQAQTARINIISGATFTSEGFAMSLNGALNQARELIVKQTRILMGMPITLEIVDASASEAAFDAVFAYFEYVDDKFSTYKPESEISRINRGDLHLEGSSEDMKMIFALAEQTRVETDGYFDIRHRDLYDPSGVVKGWAIYNAAQILCSRGFQHFYVEAGGDIQMFGSNEQGQNWRIGIRNPFNIDEVVRVLSVTGRGVATSGTYVRGQHIYNPFDQDQPINDVRSLTVIGPDIYEADRFATAAFAMGTRGIEFIESLDSFEGYMIDEHQRATYTSGFEGYVIRD